MKKKVSFEDSFPEPKDSLGYMSEKWILHAFNQIFKMEMDLLKSVLRERRYVLRTLGKAVLKDPKKRIQKNKPDCG